MQNMATLIEDGHVGKLYTLTGPEALTNNEAAQILSTALGRQIRFINLPPEQLRPSLLSAGMPEWSANALLDLQRLYREGKAATVTTDVERVLGRKPINFAQFCHDYPGADLFERSRYLSALCRPSSGFISRFLPLKRHGCHLGLIQNVCLKSLLILIGQIKTKHNEGLDKFHAVVEATVQRSRPVVLTALAAVLAFIPLTFSVFWGSLAYTLIGGTAVGTVLTLVFLPALYAIWLRAKPTAAKRSQEVFAAS